MSVYATEKCRHKKQSQEPTINRVKQETERNCPVRRVAAADGNASARHTRAVAPPRAPNAPPPLLLPSDGVYGGASASAGEWVMFCGGVTYVAVAAHLSSSHFVCAGGVTRNRMNVKNLATARLGLLGSGFPMLYPRKSHSAGGAVAIDGKAYFFAAGDDTLYDPLLSLEPTTLQPLCSCPSRAAASAYACGPHDGAEAARPAPPWNG